MIKLWIEINAAFNFRQGNVRRNLPHRVALPSRSSFIASDIITFHENSINRNHIASLEPHNISYQHIMHVYQRSPSISDNLDTTVFFLTQSAFSSDVDLRIQSHELSLLR